MKDCPKNLMIATLFKTLKMFNANAETLYFLLYAYVLCIMLCDNILYTWLYLFFRSHFVFILLANSI